MKDFFSFSFYTNYKIRLSLTYIKKKKKKFNQTLWTSQINKIQWIMTWWYSKILRNKSFGLKLSKLKCLLYVIMIQFNYNDFVIKNYDIEFI